MHPGEEYDDEEIKRRFTLYYGEGKEIAIGEDQIPYFRMKWGNLSEYVKEIWQIFSRFYNRRHDRKAFVDRHYREFKCHFSSKHEKRPKTIKGLKGVYSLKRLSEAI